MILQQGNVMRKYGGLEDCQTRLVEILSESPGLRATKVRAYLNQSNHPCSNEANLLCIQKRLPGNCAVVLGSYLHGSDNPGGIYDCDSSGRAREQRYGICLLDIASAQPAHSGSL